MRYGLAILSVILFTAPAWASKPQMGLAWNNPIAVSAKTKENNIHEKLAAEETAYLKDSAEYDDIERKLWPICTAVDSDVAENCNNLTAEQLKTSYPDETIGGLGARYSVSKEEAEMLKQRKAELEKKWAGK